MCGRYPTYASNLNLKKNIEPDHVIHVHGEHQHMNNRHWTIVFNDQCVLQTQTSYTDIHIFTTNEQVQQSNESVHKQAGHQYQQPLKNSKTPDTE